MVKKLTLIVFTAFFVLGGQFALACDGDKKKDDGSGGDYHAMDL